MPPRMIVDKKVRKGCPDRLYPHDCNKVKGAHPKQTGYCASKRVQCTQSHQANQLRTPTKYRRRAVRLPPVEVHDLTGDATALMRQLYDMGVEHVPRAARASKEFAKAIMENPVVEGDMKLLPLSDKLWQNPKLSADHLRTYLASEFTVKQADLKESSLSRSSPPKLDMWQRAIGPIVIRRKELLVIADPGTGKSFAWTNAAYEYIKTMGHRVVVVVPDTSQLANQRKELETSPSWASVAPEVLRRMITEGNPPSGRLPSERHQIRFLTYGQAGNAVKSDRTRPASRRVLDGCAIIIDEVHKLVNASEFQFTQREVQTFREYVLQDRYASLLGLTATPYRTFEGLMELIRMFSPKQPGRLKKQRMDHSHLVKRVPTRLADRCGVAEVEELQQALTGVFDEASILYYSSERNVVDYPKFDTDATRFVQFQVPTEVKLSDDLISAERQGQVTPAARLQNPSRLARLARFAAATVYANLDPTRKTLIVMNSAGMARKLAELLSAIDVEVQKKMGQASPTYEVRRLCRDDVEKERRSRPKSGGRRGQRTQREHEDEVKSHFGKSRAHNLVLVTHTAYATGHTFDSSVNPGGRGARLLISVQFGTLLEMVQLRGRVRRRQSHRGYDSTEMSDVKHVVLIPVAVPTKQTSARIEPYRLVQGANGTWKPQPTVIGEVTRVTCEDVMRDAVGRARVAYEIVMSALYMVSYGSVAFWDVRPSFVKGVAQSTVKPTPTLPERVIKATKLAARRFNALRRKVAAATKRAAVEYARNSKPNQTTAATLVAPAAHGQKKKRRA